MHVNLGGYHVRDIEFVAAFDIDKNKVGKDLSEAIYTKPNNTYVFQQVPHTGVTVERGMTHDGLGKYLSQIIEKAPGPTADIVGILKERQVDVMVSLPAGRLRAGDQVVRRAGPPGRRRRSSTRSRCSSAASRTGSAGSPSEGLPVIGDDIKSQVGATISHRVLTRLFMDRGVRLDRTYQLNFGGNTDFLNMLERERLESKKISKTNAVTSMLDYELDPDDIHVGPSDHVPWLKDRKWCYIRMEGTTFGDVPLNAELKLEVWDSPNSAGVITDAIRCLKLGLDRGLKGTLVAPASYFMKSPPHQIHDDIAFNRVEAFIRGEDNETLVGHRGARQADAAQARRRAGQGGGRGEVTAQGSGDKPVVRPKGLEAPHRRLESGSRVLERTTVRALSRDGLAPEPHAASSGLDGVRAVQPGGLSRLAEEAPLDRPELRPRPGPGPRPSARCAGSPCAPTTTTPATSWRSCASRRTRPRPIANLVEPEGLADLERIWRASDGVILAVGHVGNNEACAAGVASRGWPISVVADDSSFPEMFELFRQLRESYGVSVIPWRNLRKVYEVLRRKELLALLVDWGYRSDGIPVRLFDAWTTLPAGPASLAAKTGATILPVVIRRTETGRFRVTFDEPILVAGNAPAELQRATQAMADSLQRTIAAAPDQWYSFKPMWPETDEEAAELAARAAAMQADTGPAAAPAARPTRVAKQVPARSVAGGRSGAPVAAVSTASAVADTAVGDARGPAPDADAEAVTG